MKVVVVVAVAVAVVVPVAIAVAVFVVPIFVAVVVTLRSLLGRQCNDTSLNCWGMLSGGQVVVKRNKNTFYFTTL